MNCLLTCAPHCPSPPGPFHHLPSGNGVEPRVSLLPPSTRQRLLEAVGHTKSPVKLQRVIIPTGSQLSSQSPFYSVWCASTGMQDHRSSHLSEPSLENHSETQPEACHPGAIKFKVTISITNTQRLTAFWNT